ncbi:Aromatic ring-opening dioxygenase, catalytic subunit, LigB family [Nitrosomonas marina]|uniref:Aromatic ring-opening dioxygenase, catalytic subunit, LigB family n=1 Tax=Nitrosomonas marina TaxID=917 RepID=A0A1I0DWC0_9PROT|nr:class III extradiol ring-cleavage dioxygenase [Nitrosomonas marina]SET36530.1 Aromatic ring-opening dioxygenase, catalytic subunit, LigB family [Nitrosomonas marina]
MMTLPKSLYISHGGGPLPLLGDLRHDEMVAYLQRIAETMPRPEAIVVFSAHWEEQVPTITAARNPPLIYDYYGFPPGSYQIQYPCPGEPALAGEIFRLFANEEIDARLDEIRGFEHGVFVPLKIMYPDADMPCVQISLVNTLNPSRHIKIGSALRDLHKQNVLVMGSGFSFHNLKTFFAPDTVEPDQLNEKFENWLQTVCVDRGYSEEQRSELLVLWEEAPGARYCHPREEHLLPLHVCYGVAKTPCTERYGLTIMNKKSSMYAW